MSGNTEQLQSLLSQVSVSMNALKELERIYDEQKNATIGQIESLVAKLAYLADTQAVRATVIRELYWRHNIAADLLARTFGLTANSMRKIAGPWIIEKTCEGGCGNKINKSYTSRHALVEKRKWGKDLCDVCAEESKRADAARSARYEKERKDKYDYLINLTWDEFTETGDWKDQRNGLLYENGYGCEICHNDSCTIYIYPHKDTPQFRLGGYKYGDIFFVLCQSCVPRCEDLIDKNRRDVIRQELIAIIADRRSGGY